MHQMSKCALKIQYLNYSTECEEQCEYVVRSRIRFWRRSWILNRQLLPFIHNSYAVLTRCSESLKSVTLCKVFCNVFHVIFFFLEM